VGARTKLLLCLGVLTLLVSFGVISYGNKLKGEGMRPEVQAERAVKDALEAVEKSQK